MAHKYSNFAAAFTDLYAGFSLNKTIMSNLWTYAQNVQVYNAAGPYFTAIDYTQMALHSCYWLFYNILNTEAATVDQSYYYESFYWAAQEPTGATITMQAIINAMFLANKTQVSSFVGLMDAYRQSIWNMPFNAEMWAAVARGFQQWP